MQYRIQSGQSFLDSDGTVKTGGQLIDLSPDIAQAHADKVVAVDAAGAAPAVHASDSQAPQSADHSAG